MTVVNKSSWYKMRLGSEQDVPGIRVFDPANDCFAAAVAYPNYRHLKKLSRYDHYVPQELHEMAKKVAVYIIDRTLYRKDPISVRAYSQELKSACDSCKIHEGGAMWLYKQLLMGSAEATVKERVTLTNVSNLYHEGALKPYCATTRFLMKCCVTDDNITKLDEEVRNLRQGSITPA